MYKSPQVWGAPSNGWGEWKLSFKPIMNQALCGLIRTYPSELIYTQAILKLGEFHQFSSKVKEIRLEERISNK